MKGNPKEAVAAVSFLTGHLIYNLSANFTLALPGIWEVSTMRCKVAIGHRKQSLVMREDWKRLEG
ncbi:MAG: hypothetical protein ACLTLQ_22245 [[Clostridium] scindens]